MPRCTVPITMSVQDLILSKFRLAVPIISVSSAVLSFVIFRFTPATVVVPDRWVDQTMVLLLVYGLSGFPIGFSRNSIIRITFTGLQFGVVWVTTIPQITPFSSSLYLVLGVIGQSVIAFPSFMFFLIGILTVVTILFVPRGIPLFGMSITQPWSMQIVLVFCLHVVVFSAFLYAVRTVVLRSMESFSAHTRFEESVHRLVEANIRLQDYTSTAERHAMEQERKRISQEVHDILGHTLSTVNMTLQAAMSLYNDDDNPLLSQMLGGARDHVKRGMLELRRALASLSEQPRPQRLNTARILDLTKSVSRATGIEIVAIFINIGVSLSEERSALFYRLVQEGITNAIRHGNATRIDIHFQRLAAGLRMSIRDNGRGLESAEPGFGLKNMQDRVQCLNGTFRISSSEHIGTTLEAWLPAEDPIDPEFERALPEKIS